jgi:hypothetical protein
MNLSDIKSFGNSLGAWQSKNCYETKAERIHESIIVYNDCPWLGKDRCTDPVTIDIGSNGMGKIVSMNCELEDLCSLRFRQFYEKCLKENAFDMYVIDREES